MGEQCNAEKLRSYPRHCFFRRASWPVLLSNKPKAWKVLHHVMFNWSGLVSDQSTLLCPGNLAKVQVLSATFDKWYERNLIK